MNDSRLGKLSPELRNKIYTYATANTTIDLETFSQSGGALLHLSAEIRKEARLLLFSQTTFVMSGKKLRKMRRQTGRESSSTITRRLAVLLANTFGVDALQAIPSSRIQILSEAYLWADRCETHYLRLNCLKCTPWASRGGLIDTQTAQSTPDDEEEWDAASIDSNYTGTVDEYDSEDDDAGPTPWEWRHRCLCYKIMVDVVEVEEPWMAHVWVKSQQRIAYRE